MSKWRQVFTSRDDSYHHPLHPFWSPRWKQSIAGIKSEKEGSLRSPRIHHKVPAPERLCIPSLCPVHRRSFLLMEGRLPVGILFFLSFSTVIDWHWSCTYYKCWNYKKTGSAIPFPQGPSGSAAEKGWTNNREWKSTKPLVLHWVVRAVSSAELLPLQLVRTQHSFPLSVSFLLGIILRAIMHLSTIPVVPAPPSPHSHPRFMTALLY